ncbi:MAG: DUF3842 family protein [Spirochaetes bacterium]|nr:DUF3842 family protein [Spirochaetota bacterium]
MKITVAVIDGMGGGIGCEIINLMRKEFGEKINIISLGINAVATEKMIQAKANKGATGENAIKYSINNVDFVTGPIGIIFPNGLMGEVTKEIAEIITSSRAKKILVPVNHPDIKIIGLDSDSLGANIVSAVEELKKLINENMQ